MKLKNILVFIVIPLVFILSLYSLSSSSNLDNGRSSQEISLDASPPIIINPDFQQNLKWKVVREGTSKNNFIYIISNGMDIELTTSNTYKLEFFDGNSWRTIPNKMETMALGVIIPPHSSIIGKTDLLNSHELFFEGQYRLRKNIFITDDLNSSHDLMYEFMLTID